MDNRLRILILSDSFSAPAYKPRLRLLCDHLVAAGHNVTVVCEKFDELSFPHDYDIHEVALYKTNSRFARLDWAIKNILNLLFNWKDRAFQSAVEQIIQNRTFDIIFCTSFFTFPLSAANHIAKRHSLPSVIDLRDIVEQAPANTSRYLAHGGNRLHLAAKLYVSLSLMRRNRQLRLADAVTTVSPWHVKLLSQYNPATYLIYNGYDSRIFFPKDIPSDKFIIVYTGKVFEQPMQDPTPLFEALADSDFPADTFGVDWYVDAHSEQIVRQYAKQYGVERYMTYYPLTAQDNIPDILHHASVCLVLTNRAGDNTSHGMMTTKFFEALGVEKPVLCVRSDEECLAQVIAETNAGIAATDAEQVKQFISEKYAEWQQHGFTRQAVKQASRQQLSRQHESLQFEQLLLSVVKTHNRQKSHD